MDNIHTFSSLGKTWIFDLDGTIFVHNGYKTEDGERLLTGVKEFFEALPESDDIVFITSRGNECRESTENFLRMNNIPFRCIIYDTPHGERILVNDRKPSGLPTAFAINTERDVFMSEKFLIDPML